MRPMSKAADDFGGIVVVVVDVVDVVVVDVVVVVVDVVVVDVVVVEVGSTGGGAVVDVVVESVTGGVVGSVDGGVEGSVGGGVEVAVVVPVAPAERSSPTARTAEPTSAPEARNVITTSTRAAGARNTAGNGLSPSDGTPRKWPLWVTKG